MPTLNEKRVKFHCNIDWQQLHTLFVDAGILRADGRDGRVTVDHERAAAMHAGRGRTHGCAPAGLARPLLRLAWL